MMRGEFLFNNIPMRKEYGIAVEKSHDVLIPQLRERKITIPGKNGRYDYGASNYEERTLVLDCNIARPTTRAQLRELAYQLSKKGRIEVWDEPGKHYVGRIYDPAELEKIGQGHHKFQLTFICEPFAYGKTITSPITKGQNKINYKGTACTPALIVIKNNGAAAAENVQITAVFRKKTL